MRQSVYCDVLYACADGAIYKDGRGRIAPHITDYGYHKARVMIKGNRKEFFWHRIIARAYVPGYFIGAMVNHRDGNKINNLPSNLEWVGHRENVVHAISLGLYRHGETVRSSRLTEHNVRDIRRMIADGNPLNSIARAFGVGESTIQDIVSGRTWKRVV